jgi:hypothetical protein
MSQMTIEPVRQIEGPPQHLVVRPEGSDTTHRKTPPKATALDHVMKRISKMLGFDPRTQARDVHPHPEAEIFWSHYLQARLAHEATDEMFAPWAEVAAEDAAAYEGIAAEHWPAE